MFVIIIGLLGSALLQISMFPQIFRTYRTKSVNDLSLTYLTVLTFGLILLLTYSISVFDIVFIVGNSLSLTSTLIELIGVAKWRKKS